MASIILAVILLVGLQSSAMAMVLVDVDSGGYHKPSAERRSVQTGDVCQDCTQIFELLMDMLSNADLQKKMIGSLDTVCDLLPSSAAKRCQEQVERLLPLAITIINRTIKPDQACAFLGLCNSQALSREDAQLLSLLLRDLTAAMTHPQQFPSLLQIESQCEFCKLLIHYVERLLPKERTEGAVLVLLGKVCSSLPSFLQTQCESLIDKYGKVLLDKLLDFATAETICTFIHMCKGQERPEDCDSCVTLVALSRLQSSFNPSFQPQTSSVLPSVCRLLPIASWSKCEAFTQLYGHRLPGLLGKQEAPLDVCRALGVCKAVMHSEPQQGRDPCTLSSHRCRDMETAHLCGTVWYCQMFVWKTVSSNPL